MHDHSSFMLLNETSLADLNAKLDHVVPAVQFRPNFVVRGAHAFEEDNWKWIRIGSTVTFRNVKLCSRLVEFKQISVKKLMREILGVSLRTLTTIPDFVMRIVSR